MNRREALRTIGSGGALGGVLALAVSLPACAPTDAPAAETEIEAMLPEWRKLYEQAAPRETDEDVDARCALCFALTDKIIRATPRTPRDVAIQFWVDTFAATSDHSDEFYDRMREMVLREGRVV